MEKSFYNSEIDVEAGSIFNNKSDKNSPLIDYFQYINTNRNEADKNDKKPNSKQCSNSIAQLAEPALKSQNATPLSISKNAMSIDYTKNHSNDYNSYPEIIYVPNRVFLPVEERVASIRPSETENHNYNKIISNNQICSVESILSTLRPERIMTLIKPQKTNRNNTGNITDHIEVKDQTEKYQSTFYLKALNTISPGLDRYYNFRRKKEPNKEVSKVKRIKKNVPVIYIEKSQRNSNDKYNNKTVRCNCKNSSCIKLYCDCFRFNGLCGQQCNCLNCKNIYDSPERQKVINLLATAQTKQKLSNKNAALDNRNAITKSGCNCKKSKCQKKYCECYNRGAFCNSECCCFACLNKNNNS